MFTEQEDGPITTQSAAPFASVFTLWRTGNSYWTIYRILPGYPLNLSVLTGIMLIDKDHYAQEWSYVTINGCFLEIFDPVLTD